MKQDMIDTVKENKDKIRFFLDSGAFTAWKAGKPISLDDYCRFIESLPFEPWRYFMLDVIGNPAATMKNYEIMLHRGFKPVPIFTRGEDVSVLDDYYKNSDVVAIGGLVGTPKNKGFVKGIMDKVGERKCHWLGFTNLEFVKYFRPYSCDASSWNNGAQFGYVQSFNKRNAFLLKMDKSDFFKLSVQKKHEYFSVFASGGNKMDYSNFSGNYGTPMISGAKTWTELSSMYEKNIDVRIFMAVTKKKPLEILIAEGKRFL